MTPPPQPPLGATPEPSASDFSFAEKLKNECCPMVYMGDGRHSWPFNPHLAAGLIAAHVAAEKAEGVEGYAELLRIGTAAIEIAIKDRNDGRSELATARAALA